MRIEGHQASLCISDGPRWRITAEAAEHEPTDVDRDVVEAQRAGPVWATQRHLRRRLVLHAAAFLVDGQAFALAAFPRTGKSTVSAALRRLGAGFLADDLASIDSDLRVEAGPPFARMWPDTARWAGAFDASRVMIPGADKRIMAMKPELPEAPLAGIFLMSRGPMALSPIAPADAVPRLAAMTYLYHMYRPVAESWPDEPWHLDACTHAAATVPVWEVQVPDDWDLLPDVAAMILTVAKAAV